MTFALRILLILLVGYPFSDAETSCPSRFVAPCDIEQNLDLFPESFAVFDAYEGQTFTVGTVVIIVAKFPNMTCNLPDPSEIDDECKPSLTLSLFSREGTCYRVYAESTKKLEYDFGFSFADDPSLETDSGKYIHWAFPLHVLDGMSTSRLEVKSVSIPEACNGPKATFLNLENSRAFRLVPNIRINAQPPNIVSVHSGKSSGTYSVEEKINLVIEFSKAVRFSPLPDSFSYTYAAMGGKLGDTSIRSIPYGVPFIRLNSGALAPLIGYTTPMSRSKVTFLYVVGKGEETPFGGQLDVLNGTSIDLNGGFIVAEGSGLDLNLESMPAAGEEGQQQP